MGRKRRSYSAEFKAMVGLEALRGIETSNELARKYEVHPGLITDWKRRCGSARRSCSKRNPTSSCKRSPGSGTGSKRRSES